MADNIDTILAKLKELQQVIPGVESRVTRLQALLKAAFEGGSGAAIKGVELELQNLSVAAEKAIASMGNTAQATAAMNSLRTSIAAVNAELAASTSMNQRLAFEREYQALVQQGMAEPKIRAEAAAREMDAKAAQEQIALQERLNSVTAKPVAAPAGAGFRSGNLAALGATEHTRAQFEAEYQALLASEREQAAAIKPSASAENYDLLTAKIREANEAKQAGVTASEAGAKATTTAVQSELSALDKLIMKQREIYGFGESGRFFSKSEMVNNLTAGAGGTKAFRQMAGGQSPAQVFAGLAEPNTGIVAQKSAYQYKFTEMTLEDLQKFIKYEEEIGNSADEARKKVEAMVNAARIPAAPAQPTKSQARDLEEAARLEALQGPGLRSLFGSDQQYDKFRSRMKDLKLDVVDLKRATQDVASGMTTLSFETLDESTGILKNATVYVDEFGRVISHNTTRVKSFEDMITGNITKVMTWALALGVVYGSLQKIGELVESMKKVQDALVDIGITTHSTAQALNEVYQAVYNISQVTSTDLAGGLTAMNQALRASSSAGDSTSRTALAVKLLADSLTLAKLSGLDTKRAMDLLIAGLKQLDQPLSSGAALLDKFQAMSNQANTSMEDMATTFAITAGAADDVGVGVNDLIALIGAFSEATSLTATETGNALRAMFSNFTQPQGVETLNKYGIAVQDINGEFRSFIDVFQQASELSRSGILSERQVAEIANALGGGSRRQAQVTALLTVAPRQADLREFLDQGKAAGAAQDAMKEKVGTLSSALERLQNSFENLAKSLGTEGGFIDALSSIVNLFSKVIDLASQMSKALGPGLPLLLAGVAGYSLYKAQGPKIGQLAGQTIGALGSPLANLGAANQAAMQFPNTQAVEGLKAAGVTFGKNAFTAMLPIIPLLAGQMAESAQTGDWSGTVGMGIGAAFLGVLSGNPIWALIGGLIGKAIMDQISNNQKVAEKYAGAIGQPFPLVQTDVTAKEAYEKTEAIRKQLEALQGERNVGTSMEAFRFGPEFGTKLLPMLADEFKRLTQTMSPEEAYAQLQRQRFVMERGTNFLGQPFERSIYGTGGYGKETIQKFAEGTDLLDQSLENLKRLVTLSKDLPEDMKDLVTNQAFLITKEAFVGKATGPGSIASATAAGEIIGTPEYEYNRRKRYEFTAQLTKGDLSTGDYKQRMEALGSTGITASLVLSALNPNITTSNVQKYKDEWLKVKDALTIADQGTQTYISSTATSLTTLNEEMVKLRTEEELYKRGLSDLDSAGYATLQQRIQDVGIQSDITRKQIEALLQAIVDSNNAAKFSFKGFSDYSKYSREDMQKLVAQARALQDIYAQQTNTPLDQLVKTAPDIVTMTKEGFDTWGGVYQQFLDQVLSNVDEFRTKMEEKMKFNFKSLRNVPAEMAARLQQAMNYYTALLSKYGFNEKNELITVLFKDNQVGQLVGSQTALQLALEDLTEVEKKKLDGIYNLPSGATAFIPLQAGQLLSEYTANQAPVSNVNYGATPMTPPVPGSYPLGKPPSEMTTEELLRKFLLQAQTPLEKQAADLAATKYSGQDVINKIIEHDKATEAKYAGLGKTAPSPLEKKPESVVSLDIVNAIAKSFYGVLAPFFKSTIFGGLLGRQEGMLPGPLSGAAAKGETAPVKVSIFQERQTHEVNVAMTVNLDSRRLWAGIKRIAMEDYDRLTASVGNSQRSRGNVV